MPASSYDVVCLPIIKWRHRFQRPQQISRLFAQNGHRVFYVDLDFGKFRIERAEPGVFVTRLPGPKTIDRFRQTLDADDVQTCLAGLVRLASERNIERAVLMVQQPFWAELALAVGRTLGWKIVFDCMDEHEGLTVLNPDMLADETMLAGSADLVLVSSQKLRAKHEKTARRLLFLPSAADFSHFSQAPDRNPLRSVRRPIICYYGAIMEWFDVEMVRTIAASRPDWSIVLIGNVDIPVEPLKKLRNVRFLGEKPYAELPGYLHQFDVCLIPFRLTPIIQAANPAKFYEYLSAGKPVVATPMPELQPMQRLFYAAGSGQEAIGQIKKALAENCPARIAERQTWARGQTWQARYAELSDAIDAIDGLVSIIIVSCRNLDGLKQCLESIERETGCLCYEIVVVDDASGDDVRTFLRDEAGRNPRLRLVFNDENVGFARAGNQGLAAISPDARYVVLLNDDIVVTPGWMSGLVKRTRDGQVGLVGPATPSNGEANPAAAAQASGDLEAMNRAAAETVRGRSGLSFDVPHLPMNCVAFRRDLLTQIGPLDEAFGVGVLEDADYSMRVRNAGYRVVCAQDVFVHHLGRASSAESNKDRCRRVSVAGQETYEDKWGVKWRPPTARLDLQSEVAAARHRPVSSAVATSGRLASPAKASVVIINYNGREHFDQCLHSLAKTEQPRGGLEIVVVDNGSTDDSLTHLKNNHPAVKICEAGCNLGFSKAANLGAAKATGDYVVFLNNDMRVAPDWLTRLLSAFEIDPQVGAACSLSLNWEGTDIDFAGRPDDVFAMRYEPAETALKPGYASDRYLLALSGGSLAVRRDFFFEMGGFDPRFFMYHEDVDFGWRLWGRGYRSMLCAKSIVYHRGGASSRKLGNRFLYSLGQKHGLWTILKNADDEHVADLLRSFIYLLFETGRWSREISETFFSIYDEFQAGLSSVLSERRKIQAARSVGDDKIFASVGHPIGWLAASPQFQKATARVHELTADMTVDWHDPAAVGNAIVRWCRASAAVVDELSEMWRENAAFKNRRAAETSHYARSSGPTR